MVGRKLSIEQPVSRQGTVASAKRLQIQLSIQETAGFTKTKTCIAYIETHCGQCIIRVFPTPHLNMPLQVLRIPGTFGVLQAGLLYSTSEVFLRCLHLQYGLFGGDLVSGPFHACP